MPFTVQHNIQLCRAPEYRLPTHTLFKPTSLYMQDACQTYNQDEKIVKKFYFSKVSGRGAFFRRARNGPLGTVIRHNEDMS